MEKEKLVWLKDDLETKLNHIIATDPLPKPLLNHILKHLRNSHNSMSQFIKKKSWELIYYIGGISNK
jgi:hypothetical protein